MNTDQTADNKKQTSGRPTERMASRIKENAEAISRETFEKLNDKKRRRKILFAAAMTLLVIFLTAVFGAICFTFFFRVERVYISGCDRYPEADVISVSGIELDISMLQLNPSGIEAAITHRYPYIKAVRIKRHLPSEVELILIEDTPLYYIELGNEYFVLSESLRVLERLEHENGLKENGIRKIVTPDVSYAVVGREMRFKDPSERENVLELLASFRLSPVYDMLDLINISDKYEVYVIYGGQFKVVFGKYTDMDLKLLLVDSIIEEMDDMNGIIDVSDIKTSFAIMDSTLVLE